MTDLCPFSAIDPDGSSLVGGKALSLALLVRAGLPVPPGFCLTTVAHRRLRSRRLADDADLVAALRDAYRELGGGPVAVRSSATAEDGAAASFAGQQETFLGVVGEDALFQAIEDCWASLDSDRAVAYRKRQGVTDDGLAMAVVVQRLVPAAVAGVLFTRDPLASGRQMLVEASWGLGESVVSGRVTPDRFHLDWQTGQVIDRHVASKTTQRTPDGDGPVPPELQGVACLSDGQLADLADLGRRVEEHFGEPRDVEWAFVDGRFWLLQARPITATGLSEREAVREQEIAALRRRAAKGGTVWGRFNLSEVLPEPTPMTWAIVSRHLMSGRGGFGRMYRDLGYDPDPALDDEGAFDLVCGRPYCNLSREARQHFHRVPLAHSFRAIRQDPRRALYPTPTLDLWSASWSFWLTWPWELWRMSAGGRRASSMPTFARRFREEVAPRFRRECGSVGGHGGMSDAALLDHLRDAVQRTFVDFARESLKPTALAALSLADLEAELGTVMPADAARDLSRDLIMGVTYDAEADLPGAMRDLAAGKLSRHDFLARFGHRGSEEMELSRPRWAEEPGALMRLPADGGHVEARSIEERLASSRFLTPQQRPLVVPRVRQLHDYLALRETAKHYLMYGVAVVRRALLELDQRRGLNGGIFFLTPDELPRLLEGEDFGPTIAQRRRRRSLALGLEVPAVLFSDDLEAIGRPLDVGGSDRLEGVPLSAGVAEAPALVLEHPSVEDVPAGGYVLVCPSTDPAWVPLFVNAKALVMETGGVLSHGAIVAREFGLPAVAGLPGVVQRLRTGQRLRVDGGRGVVTVVG